MIIKSVKQVVVFVVGMGVLLVGIAGILLPIMPGWVFIPVGLAILGTEFIWARSLMKKFKENATRIKDGAQGWLGMNSSQPGSSAGGSNPASKEGEKP